MVTGTKSQYECNLCENDHCFLKKFCESSWVSLVSATKSNSTFTERQTVFHERTRVPGLYFIKKGKVKVVSGTANGEEHIHRLASEGDILGHRGIGDEVYPIRAETLEPTELCLIENDMLNDLFFANPWFTVELMMFYSKELRKTEMRSKYLSTMDIHEKVGTTLLYIHDTFGEKSDGVLAGSLTSLEIAQLNGTTSPQVEKGLTYLHDQGLIEKRNEGIHLRDMEGLQKLVAPYDPIF